MSYKISTEMTGMNARATEYIVDELQKLGYNIDAEIIAASKPSEANVTLDDVTVTWLDWGGTRRHPRAIERTAEHCSVTWTGGAMCTVHFPGGDEMRKKLDTQGFRINGTYPDEAFGLL